MPGRLIGAKKTEVNIPDTWRSDGAFMKPNIARLVSSYVLKSYLGYDLQTALLPVSDATPSNHTTAFQQKWYDVEGAEIGGVITTLLDARDDSRQGLSGWNALVGKHFGLLFWCKGGRGRNPLPTAEEKASVRDKLRENSIDADAVRIFYCMASQNNLKQIGSFSVILLFGRVKHKLADLSTPIATVERKALVNLAQGKMTGELLVTTMQELPLSVASLHSKLAEEAKRISDSNQTQSTVSGATRSMSQSYAVQPPYPDTASRKTATTNTLLARNLGHLSTASDNGSAMRLHGSQAFHNLVWTRAAPKPQPSPQSVTMGVKPVQPALPRPDTPLNGSVTIASDFKPSGPILGGLQQTLNSNYPPASAKTTQSSTPGTHPLGSSPSIAMNYPGSTQWKRTDAASSTTPSAAKASNIAAEPSRKRSAAEAFFEPVDDSQRDHASVPESNKSAKPLSTVTSAPHTIASQPPTQDVPPTTMKSTQAAQPETPISFPPFVMPPRSCEYKYPKPNRKFPLGCRNPPQGTAGPNKRPTAGSQPSAGAASKPRKTEPLHARAFINRALPKDDGVENVFAETQGSADGFRGQDDFLGF